MCVQRVIRMVVYELNRVHWVYAAGHDVSTRQVYVLQRHMSAADNLQWSHTPAVKPAPPHKRTALKPSWHD